jgi:dCMP deaminase
MNPNDDPPLHLPFAPVSGGRISIPEYAMALAHVASLRSEDPFRKVGAVAIDNANRVIGTAYNGLAPGFEAPEGFWDDREARQKYMLHAEVNLCSLFTRGSVKLVALTTKPCTSCMQMLCAYSIKEIYYRDDYPKSDADEIAKIYGVKLVRLIDYPGNQSGGA